MKIIANTPAKNPRIKRLSEVEVGTVFTWVDCLRETPVSNFLNGLYMKVSSTLGHNSIVYLSPNQKDASLLGNQTDTTIYIFPEATLHLEG